MNQVSVIFTMEDLIQRVQGLPSGRDMESPVVRELLVAFARSVDLQSQNWQPRKDTREIAQLIQDASSLGFLETSKDGIVSTTELGQSMRRAMSRIFANYGTMV